MTTFEAFAMRRSTRGFKPDQIPDEALEKILDAGCVAPVGMGAYKSMHLAVVQDAALIEKISDTVKKARGRTEGPSIYYGAPTIIVISSAELPLAGIELANGACVADHICLAATDLDIGNIYIWATGGAIEADPSLATDMKIPEGYKAVATVALGYPLEPITEPRPFERKIEISRV
ncbi:MAG: nitroreductase family protein [Oscillospiraceae bacterium]|nr:nitroreductase family protein [Oscillospiraceae bacterium]